VSSEGIKIESMLPAELINGVIQAEIVKALGDKDELITSIVRACLQEPAKDSYGRNAKHTRLEVATRDAIQEAANEAIQEWVLKAKPQIKKAIIAELNRGKQKRLKELVDSLLTHINKWYGISIAANLVKIEPDY